MLPDDVHRLARPVLAHRLLPSVEAAMSGRIDHAPSWTASSSRAGARRPTADPRLTVREALAGLTVRGRAFLAAGVTAIVCAILLGQSTLARVGVLVSPCR